ncbi:unannotated protein [freshwater metagenome]|uniref:Unannotated protein n=1 Tax=freshwater metagenome TaxID=449393 RepID=A0A6J6DXP3_9ZZZZ
MPVPIAPARYAPSAPTPKPKPTAIGAITASNPGVASSRSESRVQISTTRPYSGFTFPVIIPGYFLNCALTSTTTAPAALETALTAKPENIKTTAAPIINPTRFLGSATSSTPWNSKT